MGEASGRLLGQASFNQWACRERGDASGEHGDGRMGAPQPGWGSGRGDRKRGAGLGLKTVVGMVNAIAEAGLQGLYAAAHRAQLVAKRLLQAEQHFEGIGVGVAAA